MLAWIKKYWKSVVAGIVAMAAFIIGIILGRWHGESSKLADASKRAGAARADADREADRAAEGMDTVVQRGEELVQDGASLMEQSQHLIDESEGRLGN